METTIQAIRNKMLAYDLTVQDFAKLTNLSASTIYRILKGKASHESVNICIKALLDFRPRQAQAQTYAQLFAVIHSRLDKPTDSFYLELFQISTFELQNVKAGFDPIRLDILADLAFENLLDNHFNLDLVINQPQILKQFFYSILPAQNISESAKKQLLDKLTNSPYN